MHPPIIIFLFVVVFPAFWCGIMLLLSFLSGWSRLAKTYRYDAPLECKSHYFQSGKIGGVDFNSCLTLGVSERGLRLAMLFPFRIGYPPLLIPWDDFHEVKEIRSPVFGLHSMTATLGTPPGVKVKLPAWLIDYIEVARGLDVDQDVESLSESESRTQWPCNQCGELNDMSFDVCWKCQSENTKLDDEPFDFGEKAN